MNWTVLIGVLLLWCSIDDIKSMEVSLIGIGFFAVLGIVLSFYKPVFSIIEVLGGILVGVFLLLISWISKDAIGRGDGLLIVTCGFYLGFWGNVFLLFYGLLLAGITSGILLITKQLKRKQRIPFIPFLLCIYMGMVLF